MARALYILDPQVGFNHPSVSHVFPEILKFANRFDGHIMISKFINDLESNFVTQLDWKRFTEPEDTNFIEGFAGLDAKVFEHTTYSCMTKEALEFLEENSIDEIVIVGVFTDVCVVMTGMESFDAGFKTYVISDLVATLHGDSVHQQELKSLDLILGSKYVIPRQDYLNK